MPGEGAGDPDAHRPPSSAGAQLDRPALFARIAAQLAGEAGGTARLVVFGTLPESVRTLLPTGCSVTGAAGPDAPATGAVLMFDDVRPGDEAARRLGRACRDFPARVVVWQRDAASSGDAAQRLDATHFFALGFQRLLVAEAQGVRHALYEYRLSDYKRAPEWLNARFWANPERFGATD